MLFVKTKLMHGRDAHATKKQDPTVDVHKINVKLFAREPVQVEHAEFVPVFHSWIQIQSVPDHTLIDVADYAHVKDGPGIVLVSHEANFYADSVGGRLGFTYQRKHSGGDSFKDCLRQAIVAALESVVRLENDPRFSGRLTFRTDELLIQLNDRLNAPNTEETWKAAEPVIRQVLTELYGTDVKLQRQPDPRELFEVRATAADAPTAAELLPRLGVAAPAW
jgi:hypothetical protein